MDRAVCRIRSLELSLDFSFYRLRFHFVSHSPIHFELGKSGNVLRGAFGYIFREIACRPYCREAKTCEIRHSCPYARIFEPVATEPGPSGLADQPRPFVFRASHLDGRSLPADAAFHFDIHLFDQNPVAIAYFVLSFAQLARQGLGPTRVRATLTKVQQLDRSGLVIRPIFEGASIDNSSDIEPTLFNLEPNEQPVHHLQVRFLTPIELKAGHRLVERPEFGILLARIRDRLSTLRALYGAGPLELDFARFGERASEVIMTRCDVRDVQVSRQSTRTGQRHSLGGFTGVADYEGNITEFLPFLIAAQFAGVGRQTTWGKGEISIAGVRPRREI